MTTPRFGAIEAGGTKWVCAVGRGPDELDDLRVVPTTTPEATIGAVIDFLAPHRPLAAIGIGSFGPVDLGPGSPTWGSITNTPKPGWSGASVAGPIAAALGVPVAFETDVGAAAVGEWLWGASQDVKTSCYLTVGTGIGGAMVVSGRVLHGRAHAEMGHQWIPHDRDADPFPGTCPFHGDCLEGLACGPAIAARWSRPGQDLPDDHPAWSLEAAYLGDGIANIVFLMAPGRVVVGGSVARRPGLLDAIRGRVAERLGGYMVVPAPEEYVVAPGLGDRAGVLGALALAISKGPD
jgi:fructokinase